MNKTDQQILDQAHALFNDFGVSKVTLRQIAREVGISHSNLRYHYKSLEEILEGLHNRLQAEALKHHKQYLMESHALLALVETNYSGFQVLYEYRFFMLEFNYIMRTCPELHKTIQSVKDVRAKMYHTAFERALQQRQMKAESYPGEYSDLIERICIYSDFWIPSSEIYDNLNQRDTVIKYMRIFINMLYPYLTPGAKKQIKPALEDKKWWRRFNNN